ncbi:MAG: AraC family transcriptional regulator [Hyphomicrobiaceae bacterium]|nr:AraC family transcriptional regulator [Hyphomicrobiaceae bacterium]MCC0024325.1 AraC family transcriptional regulator [Hyphomicrobiaceae bacterium]
MHLSHLIEISQRYFSEMNGTSRALPGLEVLCRHQPSAIEAMIYEPVMCLILQGSKSVSIGDQRVEICPGDALLVGHDLPIVSRITKASLQEPYLALIFSLDLGLVRGLYEQVADASVPQTPARPLAVAPADSAWLAPLARYLDLMDYALDAKVLGPSIRREIHYRLLLSPIGKTLRDLLVADSHASRIARAIQKLRAEFRSTLSVPDLARTAGMSASSFHEHFKSVTGTTPLQYQKDLRLIAAKSLLIEQNRSVSEAAYSVGYESPTHFSRDYSRKFGLAPSRDALPLSA